MTLAGRGCLILRFVVYFRGDQALLATQNIDQIKGRTLHSITAPWWSSRRHLLCRVASRVEVVANWQREQRSHAEVMRRSAVQPGPHPRSAETSCPEALSPQWAELHWLSRSLSRSLSRPHCARNCWRTRTDRPGEDGQWWGLNVWQWPAHLPPRGSVSAQPSSACAPPLMPPPRVQAAHLLAVVWTSPALPLPLASPTSSWGSQLLWKVGQAHLPAAEELLAAAPPTDTPVQCQLHGGASNPPPLGQESKTEKLF